MVASLFRRKPRLEDIINLEVQLNNDPEEAFYPGADVSGRIVLQAQSSIFLQALNIHFFGHALTQFTRTKSRGTGNDRRTTTVYYRDNANLFQTGQTITNNVAVEQTAVLHWDFHFTFPSSTPNYRTEYTNETAGSEIWTDAPHQLPPSFCHMKGITGHSEIAYGLQVFLRAEGYDASLIKSVNLNFSPFAQLPSHVPLVEMSKHRTHSGRALIGESPNLMQRVADKLSRDKPEMNFTLKASVPSQLVISTTPFPIFATLDVDWASPEVVVPSIGIQVKKLKLCSFTMLRGLREERISYGGHRFPYEDQEMWEEKGITLNAIPEAAQVERQEVAKGATSQTLYNFPFTFQARIPTEACPAFRSFTINQSHTLKISLLVTVCEKTFELSDEVRVIVLSALSGPLKGKASAASNPPPFSYLPPQSSEASGSEAPPAYDSIEGPSEPPADTKSAGKSES